MRTLFTSVFLATSLLARAAYAEASDVAKPNGAYFIGAWDCAGFVVDPHSGHRADVVGTWRFQPWGDWATDVFEYYDTNGGRYVEWGWSHYDVRSRSYARHVTNTLGGRGRYDTRGWDQNTLVWAGEAHGVLPHGMPVVQTITRKHDEHFWITVRFFDRDQKRHDLYKADCRRKGTQRRVGE